VLSHGDGLPLPSYATPGSAGIDLAAAVAEPMVLHPGARAAVPTGIALAVPQGYEAQLRPRSGLALDHGLTVLNSPGTIDADYRGEVRVILANLGGEPVTIRRGDRIAQLVIAPVTRVTVERVAALPASPRGAGGFGSTGR
jgi:dUTP pyrophosphatase